MDARLVGSAQLFETSSYYLRQSVKGLDDEQLRQRVGKANSILWTLGHITVERLRLLNILGETVDIRDWRRLAGPASRTPVHRDVPGARFRELLPPPPFPAVVQPKTGQLRHEVQFRGPGVAEFDGVEPRFVSADEGVDRADPLRRCVVDRALKNDPIVAEEARGSPLAPVESSRVRHEGLDDEGPLRGEVLGDCLEALDLRVLRHEDEEGVEGDEDELESALGRYAGEIPDGDRNAFASGFGPQPGRHCLRGVDAMDVDSPCGKRQGHPSCTDSELERSPPPCQHGEQRRRLLGIRARGIEHVVDFGDPVPVCCRLVALHPASLSPRARSRR